MEKPTHIDSVIQICQQLFASSSWDDLIHQVIHIGLDLLQAERGTVFLLEERSDGEEKKLESLVASGIKNKTLRISINEGIAGYVFRNQTHILTNDAQTNPYFNNSIDKETHFNTTQIICVPLKTPRGKKLGALEFINCVEKSEFTKDDLKIAQMLSLFASLAIENIKKISVLEKRNKRLVEERVKNLSSKEVFLSTNNKKLQEIFRKLPDYAQSDSSVLIRGESGTGKEIVAKHVHLQSIRNKKPFVAINCAAIPESLFEAELFGIEKGAATGVAERKGKIELAHGGTLFLDEIGELPISIQAKLLRVLQDKTITPVGGEGKIIEVDFRLISATNRDLESMIQQEEFREDLFYRLNVLSVELPELKDRMDDIEEICQSIMVQFRSERGWPLKTLSEEALTVLKSYPWPGNIRELQNYLERAMIFAKNRPELNASDFDFSHREIKPFESAEQNKEAHFIAPILELPLKQAKDEVEKHVIINALEKEDGNKTKAAERLKISREGLRKAMQKLKLSA